VGYCESTGGQVPIPRGKGREQQGHKRKMGEGGAGAPGAMYNTVFIETVGAGQNEPRIREHVDKTVVVLTPGMGDAVQMDKAGILEIADLFCCNKADYPGENQLVRDLKDIAGSRPIFETIATRAKGVPELLDALL